MTKVNVKKAREKFRELLDRVAAGEEIVLLRRGKEVARLISPKAKARRLPSLEDFRRSIRVRGEPLSSEVLRGRREERY